MAGIDKAAVVAALHARLVAALDALTASQKAAQQAVVHPDAKQEHSKDMRATEASYVARGLAERVETLRDGIRALELMRVRAFGQGEPAAPGAIVTIADEDGNETLYLLAPAGGGEKLAVGGASVLVLTPRSPLGAELAGRCCGETFSVELPRGRAEMEIVAIE